MPQSRQYPTSQIRASLSKSVVLFLILNLNFAFLAESLFIGNPPVPPAVILVEQQTNLLLNELTSRKEEFTDEPEKLVQFARTVALNHWDIPRTSRLILGPYWRNASAEQRKDFQEEFLRTLLRYVVRAYGYYDEDLIKVIGYDWQAVRDGGWVLSSVQIPGRIKVDVDYRMAFDEQDKRWSLIDVRVEGISLVKVKSSEFREVVAQKGLAYLIQSMASKNNEVLEDILIGDCN